MDRQAFKNIDTLLNINENTTFIFNDKEIVVDEESAEHINPNNLNIHYSVYFTFNQIFNCIRLDGIKKNNLLDILNQAYDNLQENKSFLKLVSEDVELQEMMNDISLKLDLITEKNYDYGDCGLCKKIKENMNLFWEYLLSDFIKNLPCTHSYHRSGYNNIIHTESTSDDDDSDDSDDPDNNDDKPVYNKSTQTSSLKTD